MVGVKQSPVDMLAEALEKFAGPMAKFVIAKQIKDMGETKDSIPRRKLSILIERAINAAIYNPQLKTRAKKEMHDILENMEESNGQLTVPEEASAAPSEPIVERDIHGIDVLYS